ncbi:MAG: AAA family ATPase [Caldisericum exile]|uniref:AAA family ATPase n=1 Tax=Caldisericum exile TaxID=693075 RepID=UPI003C74B001
MEDQLEQLLSSMFTYGDLLLIGNKGAGKTNSLMVLADKLIQKNIKTVIIEDFPKWINNFRKIPSIVIHSNDILEVKKRTYLGYTYYTIEDDVSYNKNDLLKIKADNREYWIQNAANILNALDIDSSILFTSMVERLDLNTILTFAIIRQIYDVANNKLLRGIEPEPVVFIIEEAQNIFEYSLMGRKIYNELRKIYNESRNLNMHFIMCTQRLQDISTKIRGRTLLLIGKVNRDDWILKVERLTRESKHQKEILNLKAGQFLDLNTDTIIEFPLYRKPEILEERTEQLRQTEKAIMPPIIEKSLIRKFFDKILGAK